MSRYFFDLAGEAGSLDEEGADFPDLSSAKIAAVRLAGEILRDNPEVVANTKQCQVLVRDAEGRTLAQVQTLVGSPLTVAASCAPLDTKSEPLAPVSSTSPVGDKASVLA